jgi:Zn-dependent M16 (insulinase) family peptidase
VISGLRVSNLYADSRGQIVGGKFLDIRSGAPIYLLQIDTVPQVFMWVDTPADSDAGVAHSLEHLLAGKGTRGRYVGLLTEMRFSRSAVATSDDFNFYSFSSGTGMSGFLEQFHTWLEALYRPDFSDLEAEREFYHFGISVDPVTKKRSLVEKGSVYDEMQPGQGAYTYYFGLNQLVFGGSNPFGFYNSGVPDEMRNVVPADIRRFYREHYRIGPTTGFIFALSQEEDVFRFLDRVSHELKEFTEPGTLWQPRKPGVRPKYPVQPSANTEIKLFPFPSPAETDRGEVRFGWKATKSESQVDVKLLQLFFRALADGDKSLLYKSLIDSKTRALDSGASNVESLVFLENSPHFPAEFIGFSGIPGTQLTSERVEKLRQSINHAIREISQYPDNSQALAAFNTLIESYAKVWRRSQNVWSRSAPRFGLNYETEWKEYLEYLEMDGSFVRKICDEPTWSAVERRMQSGKNIWRELIDRFRLLDVPYATASVPSPQLQDKMEKDRERRNAEKIQQLIDQFGMGDAQALARFEEQETTKSNEIDKISARVQRPRFTDHPPLTPDDNIQYRQFHLENVPVIATFFDRAPTIDLGLSFDLRNVPPKYYKYLPILPRCLDSLGLKTTDKSISYADLQAQTQSEFSGFVIRYDVNPVSHRGDLRIQASTTSPEEFERGLALIQQITTQTYLDAANADRLRDVVGKRLWQDDAFKEENDYWFMNPSHAFRYQDDLLYLALSSFYTRAHWDDRLRWLLHKPVGPEELGRLAIFANETLAGLKGLSGRELSQALTKSNAGGLEGELLEYWKRNIPAFPQEELLPGLRRLAREVLEDLKTGPEKTIEELRDLRQIVLNRRALSVDITLDRAKLDKIQLALTKFLQSVSEASDTAQSASAATFEKSPLMDNVRRRHRSSGSDFPWYVGLDDPRDTTASIVFYADFPGYSQLDHKSLVRILSSKLVSGSGPSTLYTKIEEDGLAYGSSINSDPSLRLLQYYAARSPDIPSLIELVNGIATAIPQLQDESLLDYAVQKAFPVPRSMSTFTERGMGIAKDIRDGNDPTRISRFSQAILKLRSEPNLLTELNQEFLESIGPVLVKKQFTQQQRDARSLFFFVGPERLLAEAESTLQIPTLLRLYPEDFWLDF